LESGYTQLFDEFSESEDFDTDMGSPSTFRTSSWVELPILI
jgi:hypothetical protein